MRNRPGAERDMMQLSRVYVVGGGGDKGNKGVAVGSVCSAVCGAIWLTPSFIRHV